MIRTPITGRNTHSTRSPNLAVEEEDVALVAEDAVVDVGEELCVVEAECVDVDVDPTL